MVVRPTEPRTAEERVARFLQLRERYEAEQAAIAALGPSFCGKHWFGGRCYSRREMDIIRGGIGEDQHPVVDDDDEEII